MEIEHRRAVDTDPLEDRVLLTEIVRALVAEPALVAVTEKAVSDEHIILTISCAPGDRGKVIGKQGKNIAAVRQVFNAIGGIDRRAVEIALEGEPDRARR